MGLSGVLAIINGDGKYNEESRKIRLKENLTWINCRKENWNDGGGRGDQYNE